MSGPVEARRWTLYVCPGCGTYDASPWRCGDTAGCGRATSVTVAAVEDMLAGDGLREALEVAAEDLLKAANQFAGLGAERNARRFTEKAGRASEALSALRDHLLEDG